MGFLLVWPPQSSILYAQAIRPHKQKFVRKLSLATLGGKCGYTVERYSSKLHDVCWQRSRSHAKYGRRISVMFTSLNPRAIGFTVPFAEALELASTNGFEGLDLPVQELSELSQQTSLQSIKERFEIAHLRSGGWSLPVDFRHDEDTYQDDLAKLASYASIAQALESPWCTTGILPFSDQLDYNANMAFHIRRLRPVAQILADHGCQLGLEFIGPRTLRQGHRYEFIATMAEALELGDQLGSGNTGLLLDCWHWYTAHGTLDDLKHLTAKQVTYVHVNDAPTDLEIDAQIDNQRLLPGASGIIDIAAILHVLDHMKYDGPVVVEPFNAELNALPYAQRVKETRASLSKIWSLAGLHL
jgi:sugar phosphate isomerase/epimerase